MDDREGRTNISPGRSGSGQAPGRPAWFWPLLTGILLVPIVVAAVLFLDSQRPPEGNAGRPAQAAPPPAATPTSPTAEAPDVAVACAAGAEAPEPATEPDLQAPDVGETIPREEDDVPVEPIDDAIPPATEITEAPADVGRKSPPPSSDPTLPGTVTTTPSVTAQGHGELRVQARPWALVEVDGQAMGMTPRTFQLAPGTHRVKLAKGSDVYVQRVVVAPGRSATIFHDFGAR